MAADRLTLVHRQAQLTLRDDVLRSLVRLWPAMDWSRLDATFPAWADAVSTLVTGNRARSTALAADYLRRYRLSKGIPGVLPIRRAPAVEPDRLDTVLAVTTVASVKAASSAGRLAEVAMANAFVRSSGAITRLVLEGGRETITATVAADPRATGWERVTSANPCDFCSDVAEDATHGMECHDGCGCSAQPTFA